MAKLNKQEIEAIVSNYIQGAIGRFGDQISRDREQAIERYYSKPYGDERDGRSSVLTSECRDTVGWMLPSLLDVFMSSDKVVSFEPETPEDMALSDQVTDYVNYVFFSDNKGYDILRTWFSDALISKNGFVKWYWDDDEHTIKHKYSGLDNIALNQLLSEDGVKEISRETYTEEIYDNATQTTTPIEVSDVEIERKAKVNKIKIENIAPENILVDPQATSVKDARFIAHIARRTRAELIRMGYDKKTIMDLPGQDYDDYKSERQERLQANSIDTYYENESSLDPSMEKVVVYECYVKIDEKQSGLDELRMITVAGQGQYELLSDEAVDEVPIATLTPYHQPHVFFGRSVVDETDDIQRINTSLMRGILDYMYLTVNPRYRVDNNDKGALSDLMRNVPGGLVRANPSTNISPLANPALPDQYFGMFEKLDQIKALRTGVIPLNQGLDADTINQTATGVNKIMQAGKQREKLIAREFAETGITDLFKGIYSLTVKHQDIPRTVRLRNEWVNIDPTQWPESMDLQVSVGLGTGDKEKQLGDLNGILEKQKEALQVGLADTSMIYNTLSKMLALLGYKDSGEFFLDPEQVPPQQPQEPQPTIPDQIAMQNIESERKIAEMKSELDKYKADMDNELEKYKVDYDNFIKEKALELKYGAEITKEMGKNVERTQKAAKDFGGEDEVRVEPSVVSPTDIPGVVGV